MDMQTTIRQHCATAFDLSMCLTTLSSKAAEMGLPQMAEQLAAYADEAEAVGEFEAFKQGVTVEELADADNWHAKEAA